MQPLLRDLRYALRSLRRSPVFTVVAAFSIALGIGANTAIFTLVDQVLLRLLPVKEPRQLVLLSSQGRHFGSNRGGNALSYPMYEDFRDENQVFDGMFCRYPHSLNVSFRGETERVQGELVSGTYFPVLGVGAVLGRTITPDDDRTPGGHPVAMLTYGYWQSRFAGDPSILGQTLIVNDYPLTVIGVSEPGFEGVDIGSSAQIRVPVMMKAQMTAQWNDLDNRRSRWVNVFGRLKPGLTAEDARTALQPFFHNMLQMEVKEAAFNGTSPYVREEFVKSTIQVLPASQGRSSLRQQLRRPLWVLMATVGLVLLIACANVANLLIARATARQREIAVRLALGAGRARIVRQLLVESMLLALIGGVVGVGLASFATRFLLTFLSADTPNVALSPTPDFRILIVTFGASILTGLIFGLVPALQATRPDVAPTLKNEAGAVVGGGHVRLRKALVVAQVTLSLLLLIGAGLFIRSLQNLRTLDPGFKIDNLIEFSMDTSLSGYAPERTKQFYMQLMDRLRVVPGVTAAGFNAVRLLSGDEWDSTVTVEGYDAKPGEDMNPYCNLASAGYFASLGIPMLAGRDFTDRDHIVAPEGGDPLSGSPPFKVAIANQAFVTQYFGDANPIGRHIGFGGNPGTPTPIETIGVVGDAKYTGLREDVPRQLFFPYLESTFVGGMTAYVRTSGEPGALFGAIRRAAQEIDPNQPIYGLRTLEAQVDESLVTERLTANLSSLFGGLATVLAVIGLYGVMAYSVARRTREIGVRMALGANAGKLVKLVMTEVFALVLIGLAIGVPAAWGLSRMVQNQLYGITPGDPMTIALAVLLLIVVTSAAGAIPALRAARIDPLKALRYE